MEDKSEILEEKVDIKLAAGETDDVNSEVVPSVDSDKNSSDLNLPAKLSKFRENLQKRKRPRRKSKKGKYPYLKNSWQQRRDQSERAQRVRQQMFAHGQPVAPYNTNQFLIEDHGDVQNIDEQLQIPGNSILRPSRARDSSFSIDSDEDYFYSSPEDEEEFLTKEFSNAYEDLHVERLSSMSKSEIIHDYLQLEAKYEKSCLELKRLRKSMGVPEESEGDKQEGDHDRDTDTSSKSENEVSEQLRVSQLENKSLKVELEELRKENKTLRTLVEKNQSSSVDSESDSSSTSSLSRDSSSSEGENSDAEMMSTNNDSPNINDIEQSSEVKYSVPNGIVQNGNVSDHEEEEDEEQKNSESEK